MEKIILDGAMLIAFVLILWAAKVHFYGEGEKYPLLGCPRCKGDSNVFVRSYNNKIERICPECADREMENLPKRV